MSTNKCKFPGCTAAPFATAQDLANHIAATHAGTANLCLACGRAMAHASSLARHTRDQHANPDGFPCYLPGCPETFSRQESLGAHLEQKHGEVLREAVDLWVSMQ